VKRTHALLAAVALCLGLGVQSAQAGLIGAGIYNGNVGLSVDAVGSNNSPVGSIQATIPAGATIRKALLYAAGTPYPWYSDSPRTVGDYNGAGITLAGTPVTNFSRIVGATSTRADIGKFYTGVADVTDLVRTLATGGPDYDWTYTEGQLLNSRIDGGVLAIVYEDPSLPLGSVVLLDGGQNTGGETTVVSLGEPLGDVTDPGFFADMGLAISFSTGGGQRSEITVNGTRLTSAAGGYDDGIYGDGGLITAGGIGDSNTNPADPSDIAAADDELYSLVPFLQTGDTSFSIFTVNPTNDDNIFFMGLRLKATVESVPEPGTMALLGVGLLGLGIRMRRR